MSEYAGKKFYVFSESVAMRKQMDGLIHLVKGRFDVEPFDKSSFIFCNTPRGADGSLSDSFYKYTELLSA